MKEELTLRPRFKKIQISQVPPELIRVRDNWRHYWQWIPVIGSLYHRFVYVRKWGKWTLANNIGIIEH